MSDGECEAGPSSPTPGQEEYDSEGECRVRKKRAVPTRKQREWIEFGRWDRSELSDEDIDKTICNILNNSNRDAGLGTI